MNPSREPLLEHQTRGVEWIEHTPFGLLADEPGLGKSRQAIHAYDGGRNLVIAPAMVLDGATWDDELAAWSDHPERWTQASYTGLNAREKLGGSATRPIAGQPRPEFEGPWDAIIVDEAHYIKNAGTNWTETIHTLGKKSGAVLAMTGTPISHWAPDLFTTLQLLNPRETAPGKRFGSKWRWLEGWFDVQASRFGGPNARVVGELLGCTPRCSLRPAHSPCKHYRKFAEDNLGDQFLRRLREDCLDLPPLRIQRVATPMDSNARRMYRELRDGFATDTAAGVPLEAWSTGSQITLMTKLTTSAWLLEENPKTPPRGGKFDLLKYDLTQRTRPTLVVAHYQDTVDAGTAVAQELGLRAFSIHGGTSRADRRSIVQDFKAGRVDVLSASLEVISEGLQLTAADMAIFVEKSYKPSRNKQARDRIHRLGQNRPCTVREYITPKSIDFNRTTLLDQKTDHQMRVLSAASFLEIA